MVTKQYDETFSLFYPCSSNCGCIHKGFDVHRAAFRNIIPIVKPTRCTNVTNLFYFGMTVHVSDGLSVHHQQLKTVHTAIKQILLCACYQADNSISLTNACCCMYSLELLMMDGKTVRNM